MRFRQGHVDNDGFVVLLRSFLVNIRSGNDSRFRDEAPEMRRCKH